MSRADIDVAAEQEALVGILNDGCLSLQTQADIMCRCLLLRPSASDAFKVIAREALSQLVDAISRSREDLCVAASRQVSPGYSSERSALSAWSARDNRDKMEQGTLSGERIDQKTIKFHSCMPPVDEADVLQNERINQNVKVECNGRSAAECKGCIPVIVSLDGEDTTGVPNKSGSAPSVEACVCQKSLSEQKVDIPHSDQTMFEADSEPESEAPSSPRVPYGPNAKVRKANKNVSSKRGNFRTWMKAMISCRKRHSNGNVLQHTSSNPKEDEEFWMHIDTDSDDRLQVNHKGFCVGGTMNPTGPGRLAWDMLVIAIVSLDAVVLPFQLSYKDGEAPDSFDSSWMWITTVFFAVDIVASFFTSYQDTDNAAGTLVTSKYKIAKHYMKTWFGIDFLSTLPWGKLADVMPGSGSSSKSAHGAKLIKVLKFVRFLRLVRMLRLAKLAVIWERVEAHMGNLILKQSVSLLRVLFVLISICHWNACIWWLVGQESSFITDMLSADTREHYMAMEHWTTVWRGTGQEQWRWIDKGTANQYIFCFYWTLGVMRTMPAEVQPENTIERLYIMVFMFFAFSAFAICVALITQTFFKFSERKRAFDEDMAAMRMHMRKINADEHLQESVKSFLRHLYDQRKIQARENSMIQMLPSSCTSLLKHCRLGPYLQKLIVLDDLPPEILYHVSEIAQIKDIAPGVFLARRGCPAEAAYVLMNGLLSIKGPDNIFHEVSSVELVDADCLRTNTVVKSLYTIVSCTCSEVVKVDRSHFFDMLRENKGLKRSWLKRMTGMDENSIDENWTRSYKRRPSQTISLHRAPSMSAAAASTTAAIVGC